MLDLGVVKLAVFLCLGIFAVGQPGAAGAEIRSPANPADRTATPAAASSSNPQSVGFQIFSPTLPVREQLTFSFRLNEGGPVRLRTYDLSGRLVADLFNGRLPAGSHNISWDSGQVGFGTYVLLMEVAGTCIRKKFNIDP